MSQRNDAKRALLGHTAAAGMVAQLCLASAAWSQSPPAATVERSAFIANAWSAHDRDVYEQAGTEWAKRGRHDLAVAWLSEAIMLDPTDSRAYYDRGNSWFLLADYGKAIDDYSAEIRIAGDHARSYYQGAWRTKNSDSQKKLLSTFSAGWTRRRPICRLTARSRASLRR